MASLLYSFGQVIQAVAPSIFATTVSPPVAAGLATAAIANDVGHRYIPSFPCLRTLSSTLVNIGSIVIGTGVGFLATSAMSTVALPFAAVRIVHVMGFAFIAPRAPTIISYAWSWIPPWKTTNKD
ncbi:MAG TPA: hypothetical protein VHK67_06275 [Rhabdochlamydiaceae bacterium]|jgi:hypothetical protein|nr:hypothetical protein [Rhabdochlamydiaceae bacterium]